MNKAFDALCERLGLCRSFFSADLNREIIADRESLAAVAAGLGYPAADDAQAAASLAQLNREEILEAFPFTHIIFQDDAKAFFVSAVLPEALAKHPVGWRLTLENGATVSGTVQPIVQETVTGPDGAVFCRCRLSFSLEVPQGYHDLTFSAPGVPDLANTHTRLIVTPRQCYLPPELEQGGKVWGIPLQLYALRSRTNRGMGNFSDLKNFASLAASLGAGLVGINPLTALFADHPEDASPYFCSSRRFLNPLYIDIEAVPERFENPAYEAFVRTKRFKELAAWCEASAQVEYAFVAEMIYGALSILFDTFRQTHLTLTGEAKTARGEAFLAFCAKQGKALVSFATFQALRSWFKSRGEEVDHHLWPEAYRDPDSLAVKSFQNLYADSIQFIQYQQFVAFSQFEEAAGAFLEKGLIGLYKDLPVGVANDSAETWSAPDLFVKGVDVGAPPDLFNPDGQNWSLAAFHPRRLRRAFYEPFIRILRAAFTGGGAVRLDHAFSLMRLYLCPKGLAGVYLSYPVEEMMALVALESTRNRCLVIAEDLGTPPPLFYDYMRAFNMLSFRLMPYQRAWDGTALPPEAYELRAAATFGTHDLPTMAAFLSGEDVRLADELGLIDNLDARQTEKAAQKEMFAAAFEAAGLPGARDENRFALNAHAFLARSASRVVLVRLEDVFGQIEQVNVPGTYLEYPNWRFKLPVFLEDMAADPVLKQTADVMKKNGR